MTISIFLAGAAGAVGSRLVPLLLEAGHDVTGTTRSPQKAAQLRGAGITPVVVDVYDLAALTDAVKASRPQIVIHQLTDLPPGLDPGRMAASVPSNARLRDEGTRNLIAAAQAAGARRIIAQSIAWTYRAGGEPHTEDSPLDIDAQGARGITIGGVVSLERQTLGCTPIEGIILRYGQFYGPGTGFETPRGAMPIHVDAAAYAALKALDAAPGIYNVAEDGPALSTSKARRELGWDPGFRIPVR